MRETNAQLLLNCPKCDSGKLMFNHPEPKVTFLECMDCKFTKGSKFETLLEAAVDWNKR